MWRGGLLETLMKVGRLSGLCRGVDHSWLLLMGHSVTLVLMKFWCTMRTIESHAFWILTMIMLAVALLRLILLLLLNDTKVNERGSHQE